MQKCKKCNASWDINSELTVCPFCGVDLREKQSANSIEEAFDIILKQHGIDVFKKQVLLGLLGDYAPYLVKERRIIKVALEAGAYKAIIESSDSNRLNVFNKYVALLEDSHFWDRNWSSKVLMWCMNIMDVDNHFTPHDRTINEVKSNKENKTESKKSHKEIVVTNNKPDVIPDSQKKSKGFKSFMERIGLRTIRSNESNDNSTIMLRCQKD